MLDLHALFILYLTVCRIGSLDVLWEISVILEITMAFSVRISPKLLKIVMCNPRTQKWAQFVLNMVNII